MAHRYERLVEAHSDLLELGPARSGRPLPHSRKVAALRVSVGIALLCTLQSEMVLYSLLQPLGPTACLSMGLCTYACPLVVQRGLALFPANRQLLQRCVHGTYARAGGEPSLGLLSDLARSFHDALVQAY